MPHPDEMLRSIALSTSLLILVAISLLHGLPPKPMPVNVPEAEFSAARAMADVGIIGAHPHPARSKANAEVRDYLMNRLTTLGYKPEIQSADIGSSNNLYKGHVQNILVRIPGTHTGKALLLVAHYDSVPEGPGAADDAASVSAILEVLRALTVKPKLQNDLICLLTDSEENGLLGAEAFVQQHPWAKDVGLALNFEYRGNSGAFMMFETSEKNGKLIEGVSTAAPFIQTNSLMYEVYKRLPNDTDFTVFKRAGISGMNFAAIEGYDSYHTQLDRPELLNQGTLQHEGDIMVALVNYFGNLNLVDLKSENKIFFDFPGFGIVHYPIRFVVPMDGLLGLLIVILFISSYQAKEIRVLPTILVAPAFPLLVLGLYYLNKYLWLLLTRILPGVKYFAYYDNVYSYCLLIGFLLINAIIYSSLLLSVKKYLKIQELSLGIATFWLVIVLLLRANGASFIFFWPLLAILIMLLLFKYSSILQYPNLKIVLLILSGAPGILILSPLIKNLFVALTAETMFVPIVLFILLLSILMPVLAECSTRKAQL